MKRIARNNRGGIWIAGTTLAIATLLLATPAEAGHKQRRHHHGDHHGDHHGKLVRIGNPHRPFGLHHDTHPGPILRLRELSVPRHHHRRHFRFEVPTRIHRHDIPVYQSYHHGRAWFRPHRHSHTVYSFPVFTSSGWIYQPHSYCEGVLYTGAHVSYHGKHVSFSVGF